MHPDNQPSSDRKFAKFLHDRPWIWVVLGYISFVVAILSVVVIAVKNREPSVPLEYHGP